MDLGGPSPRTISRLKEGLKAQALLNDNSWGELMQVGRDTESQLSGLTGPATSAASQSLRDDLGSVELAGSRVL
jgi:hypothetical protein